MGFGVILVIAGHGIVDIKYGKMSFAQSCA